MSFYFRIRPVAAWMMLVVAAIALLASPLTAQQTTGSVTGTVQDASGAVIPNAVVVLTNLDNNTKSRTTSNGGGNFTFPAITAGPQFKVTASAPNFNSWESQPFPIRPGDLRNFDDVKLTITGANDSVTVESVNQAIKPLDSGERSDVITAKDLETLALVGRDATELIRMLPGFALQGNTLNNQPANNSQTVGLSGPTGSYSANGTGTNGIQIIQDGVSLTDIAGNSGSVQTVNADFVEEVKATTSAYGADNAKGPIVLNAETKAGTSAYHGSGYLYTRNAVLNANDWYNNFLHENRPAGTYYYPGGTFGGPIPLPFTSYNKNHDKLFFFFGLEFYRQNYQSATLGAVTPTLAERTGDFSVANLNAQLCGARPDGAQNPNSLTPACYAESFFPDGTAVLNGNVNTGSTTPGDGPNTAGGVGLVNWLPLPNADPFTNPFGFNYIQQVIQPQNGSQLHGRIDWHINDSNLFFVSYGRQSQLTTVPVDYGYIPTDAALYPGQITDGDVSNTLSLNYTHIFNASVVNELSLAGAYVYLPGNEGNPAAVGRFTLNNYNCSDPTARAAGTCGTSGNGNFNYLGEYKNSGDFSVPALQDYGNDGFPQLLMPGGFYNNQIHLKKFVPDISDNVSIVKGAQTIKTGFYFERGIYNGDATYGSYPQGLFAFDPGNGFFEYNSSVGQNAQYYGCQSDNPLGQDRLSGAADTGACINPVAMMYTGEASSFTQTNFTPIVNMKYLTVAGYINDSVKLKRITFQLGTRVEHLGPWADRKNNGLATFSPALYSSQCDGRLCSESALPGVTYHGLNSGVSNSVNSPAKVYFSPRVGLAWDIRGNDKTVLRGGWGVYRNQEEFNPYALAASTAQGYKTSFNQGQLPFQLIDDSTPITPEDFSLYTLSPNDTQRPIHYEYTLQLDQRLPFRSLLEVAYVGSNNVNLTSFQNGNYNELSDINKIPYGGLWNADLSDLGTAAEPGGASITTGGNGAALSSFSTANGDFFRTYNFYQHIYQLSHSFYASYNSLQVSWNKNAGFFSYGANYTFSKDLATAASYNSTVADPFNTRNDYNPVPFDRSQVFNIHYLLDLGTRYHGSFRPLAVVANGWQLSGISTVQSGPPLASIQGENFGFGYGQISVIPVPYGTQVLPTSRTTCKTVYNISSGLCVNNLSPIVWTGSPDYQLQPTVLCNPAGGPNQHQFINPSCFGIPQIDTQGAYRLPYIHGPAFQNHDLTLLKNIRAGEKRNLQLRIAAFNFLNHPLVSFNNNQTNNLNLGSFVGGVVGKALSPQILTYPQFGIANVKYGNRLIELSAKYQF